MPYYVLGFSALKKNAVIHMFTQGNAARTTGASAAAAAGIVQQK
jgi:hypothetical protein